MPSSLSPPLDLTQDLRELAALDARGERVDDFLGRGLEWLARVAPYDLATVFVLDGETLVACASAGPLADERPSPYSVALAGVPSLRDVLETRRARAFRAPDSIAGDAGAFAGLLDGSSGRACMAAPIAAGDCTFGVLTLDRAAGEYDAAVVSRVEVYGRVLAVALRNVRACDALERLRRQDREHARLLDAELWGDAEGVFTSSRCPAVLEVVYRARQVAETATPVLILGEAGAGKRRLARAIHRWSRRAEQSFAALECAAVPERLLESALFGQVDVALVPRRERPGRLQIASGGTLLLDEVGELPLELQAKLLRVLQEGCFEPAGSERTFKADVRIVATSRVDLRDAVRTGRFLQDLYDRLSLFPLTLPPLRERTEDLPRLCGAMLEEQARRTGRRGASVTPEGLAALRGYRWPGNLRELTYVLERAVMLSTGPSLGTDVLDVWSDARPRLGPTGPSVVHTPVLTLDEAQRRHIESVLARTSGRLYGRGGAAEILGVKPSTLQSRMKKLGVRRPAAPARNESVYVAASHRPVGAE
jgi:transcriptional regulator with GAF, ATPase, and Fis domain